MPSNSSVTSSPMRTNGAQYFTALKSGILDVLGDYLTAMTGVFSYGGRRPSQNVYLV